jgi:hypothetical protein
VRTPSKVPKEISDNENVTIIQGTLEDEEGLKKAAACGASIFVSFAGPTYGSKGTVRPSLLDVFGFQGKNLMIL